MQQVPRGRIPHGHPVDEVARDIRRPPPASRHELSRDVHDGAEHLDAQEAALGRKAEQPTAGGRGPDEGDGGGEDDEAVALGARRDGPTERHRSRVCTPCVAVRVRVSFRFCSPSDLARSAVRPDLHRRPSSRNS